MSQSPVDMIAVQRMPPAARFQPMYGGRYIVEVYRDGEWRTYDETTDLEDATDWASALCETLPEDRVRLTDYGGNVLA